MTSRCVADLAAIVPAGADPSLGFSVGAQGTVNVLQAARTCGVRADLGYTPDDDLARGVPDYGESLRRLDLQPTAQESESSWSTGSALRGAGPSST